MKYDKNDPNLVVLRADDVLQTTLFTKQQNKAFRNGKTWFQWFLEIDKDFEKYGYPMMLAICTEGIATEKEWVDHIKKNIHRYKIAFHGTNHYRYGNVFTSVDECEKDLRNGIKILEETFGEKIDCFYPPFGGKHMTPVIDEACKRIGIEHNGYWIKHGTDLWLANHTIKGYVPFQHANFHFWFAPQNEEVREILKIICEK